MDQWKADDFSQPFTSPNLISGPPPINNPNPDFRPRSDMEVKDPIVARKVQKADREKLRRDRLNEHFLELGKAIDPDRPKNDKGTILGDTIQVLKDLTAEVGRLKAEYTALSEESHELTQEKNELREEKASLKSEVDNLHLQYQQRARVMYPWASVDPSVVMAPPTYPYPVPYSIPPGTIPMHPGQIPMQPFTFFANQSTRPVPNPCSTFIPYPNPGNHHVNPTSTQCASTSRVSSKHDSKSNGSDHCRGSSCDKSDDSNDVATELELKIPGSTVQKDKSPAERKGKQMHNKEKKSPNGSTSSRYSSSQDRHGSSSNSTGNPQG